MKVALFPGSFDPITIGHLDLIRRASKLFDEVIVVVLVNQDKSTLFSIEERVQFIKERTKDMVNVSCCHDEGLSVNLAKKYQACAFIRGVRNVKDFEYEQTLSLLNKELDDTIETVVLYSDPKLAHISSSAVKEMVHYGVDVSAYVGEHIAMKMKYKIMGDAL